jgi:hypothetical protein
MNIVVWVRVGRPFGKEGKVHELIGYEGNESTVLRFCVEVSYKARICLEIGLPDAVPFERTC